MITSMTGYGDAQGVLAGIELTVEIRSLNNRYYKPNIRLPDDFSYLEPSIDLLLRKAVARGSLVYALRVRPADDASMVQVNFPALRSLLQDLRELERDLGFEGSNIDLAGLLQVPGLIQPVEQTSSDREQTKELVIDLTNKALATLIQMRQREGQVLHDDLLAQLKTIRQQLELVKTSAPQVVETYQAKLTQRVAVLLNGTSVTISDDDLAREVAIFAERCDISEEIVRLGSHLDHLEKVCQTDGKAAGRRLDFIAQEMLREANTIGSKASDGTISAAVVDIKAAIDRIKEQVQNVE